MVKVFISAKNSWLSLKMPLKIKITIGANHDVYIIIFITVVYYMNTKL